MGRRRLRLGSEVRSGSGLDWEGEGKSRERERENLHGLTFSGITVNGEEGVYMVACLA